MAYTTLDRLCAVFLYNMKYEWKAEDEVAEAVGHWRTDVISGTTYKRAGDVK